MVNFSPINCPNERREYNQKFKELLNEIFRYTRKVNAHVIYNFLSPTNKLGEFDFILFIDIPYERGNYYRTANKVYLNTLAIAVRKFDEAEVIDADNECFYTEEGSWDYLSEIESDRQALRGYVYDNIPNVKHFDIAIIYMVNAPKCKKQFRNKHLCFNIGFRLSEAIDNTIIFTQNKDGIAANCICYQDKGTANDWSDFLTNFIDISDEHTHQGILTKKKVDQVTKKKTGRLLEQASQTIGNQLCIIKGKAGTGKTLALLRLMYEQVRKGDDAPKHNCRLLTFNNMLVMELRMILKCIGEFTPTKASISSLHKFFYDIYKISPVRYLHMDGEKINALFNLCMIRTMRFNFLMHILSDENQTTDVYKLIHELDLEMQNKESRIKKEDRSECKEYQKYLKGRKEDLVLSKLFDYSLEYVDYKRKTFLAEYHRKEFLNGYNVILDELYLVFHNLDDFLNKYGMKIAYSADELRNTENFKAKYQEIFNNFLNDTEQQLQNEYGDFEGFVPSLMKNIENLDREVASTFTSKTIEEQKEPFVNCIRRIKRKVNWSKLILVDEAQDCQVNEKALLFELNGSDNTVIATGGRDQLIRTAQENDWSQLFGKGLLAEIITLRNVSYRQKENIVLFLNAFAESFNIETRLSVPDETKNTGRIIIDCRIFNENQIPLDIISSLHLNGKDMGCSNYENMMFLLPKIGYVERWETDEMDVVIDNNDTILINQASPQRRLSMGLPDGYKPIDGTVNDKREVLNKVGQDNTRCLLYESCRGLEAWNVMCMDLNNFYYEKITSKEAEEYAGTHIGGLFKEGRDKYMAQYASLWCFMAMTRAIDTLYIKLSNTNNYFSQTLLKAARSIANVEILDGEYVPTEGKNSNGTD